MEETNKLNDFILIGVIAGLVAILDYIGVIIFPIGIMGASAFYIGSAFYTAFAIWFKGKALISIYIGLLLGALISGTFTIYAFLLAWGNVIGVIIPMIFFKKWFNMELKKPKDFLGFIISVTILQSVISSAWVLTGFYYFGIMPAEAIVASIYGWLIGDVIVSIIIGIPLLKYLSPFIKKTSLFVKKFW